MQIATVNREKFLKSFGQMEAGMLAKVKGLFNLVFYNGIADQALTQLQTFLLLWQMYKMYSFRK